MVGTHLPGEVDRDPLFWKQERNEVVLDAKQTEEAV